MYDQQRSHTYVTDGGLRVTRQVLQLEAAKAQRMLASTLDRQRGLWLASSFEYPGRYKRYELGFSDPPLVLEGRGRHFRLEALNQRGEFLLRACLAALTACPEIRELACTQSALSGEVPGSDQAFYEEARTRVPSVFSVLRVLCRLFASPEDRLLGLYGAFGYDLVFQFEALRPLQPRASDQRDLVLYLRTATCLGLLLRRSSVWASWHQQ